MEKRLTQALVGVPSTIGIFFLGFVYDLGVSGDTRWIDKHASWADPILPLAWYLGTALLLASVLILVGYFKENEEERQKLSAIISSLAIVAFVFPLLLGLAAGMDLGTEYFGVEIEWFYLSAFIAPPVISLVGIVAHLEEESPETSEGAKMSRKSSGKVGRKSSRIGKGIAIGGMILLLLWIFMGVTNWLFWPEILLGGLILEIVGIILAEY